MVKTEKPDSMNFLEHVINSIRGSENSLSKEFCMFNIGMLPFNSYHNLSVLICCYFIPYFNLFTDSLDKKKHHIKCMHAIINQPCYLIIPRLKYNFFLNESIKVSA